MKLSFHFGLVAALAACSGEADQSLLPTEASNQADSQKPIVAATGEAVFVPRTAQEAEAEFLQGFATPLSEEERSIVEDALVARGDDLNRTQIVGRMIVRDDTYRSADSILEEARAPVEKGRVAVDATLDYARVVGGIFEMRKPFFGRYGNIKIIVPNNTVRDIMQQAADAVENASNDCITSSVFSVMLQSDWDALQIGQADYPAIRVVYGAVNVACPNSPSTFRGCANSPQFYSMRLANGTSQHRLGVGYRIGLNSAVIANNAEGVSTATHELLHTLGVGHTYLDANDDSTYVPVPGTVGGEAPLSIMDEYGTPTRSLTMQADDILTLDTLYSPAPGGTCAFTGGYEPTCAASCTKISIWNMAGDCCWCNGTTPKQLVKAAWSTQTYLCQ